jgi:pantoate--beta-alanine ligase
MVMQVAASIEALRTARAALPGSVGVVTTMGALHEGHLSLVRAAKAAHDSVLVTIFVNPLQFGANEDLSKYPRPLERDLDLLRAEEVSLVFTPTPAEMYPPGFQSEVRVPGVGQRWEGEQRPGHFNGVATVVSKLFNLTQPTQAFFGQKDAQQAVVLKRMIRDLNFPMEIVVCPTTREPDGLAMSSRNVYLNADDRKRATAIYRAIQAAGAAHELGEREPAQLETAARQVLDGEGIEADYVALVDPSTLEPVPNAGEKPLLMLITARVGTTRLLDNALLPLHLNTTEGLTVLGA